MIAQPREQQRASLTHREDRAGNKRLTDCRVVLRKRQSCRRRMRDHCSPSAARNRPAQRPRRLAVRVFDATGCIHTAVSSSCSPRWRIWRVGRALGCHVVDRRFHRAPGDAEARAWSVQPAGRRRSSSRKPTAEWCCASVTTGPAAPTRSAAPGCAGPQIAARRLAAIWSSTASQAMARCLRRESGAIRDSRFAIRDSRRARARSNANDARGAKDVAVLTRLGAPRVGWYG